MLITQINIIQWRQKEDCKKNFTFKVIIQSSRAVENYHIFDEFQKEFHNNYWNLTPLLRYYPLL